jgi:tRNA U34 5-carboxymethylaminomethyl modifying GTPase MnmE/TrmE
VQEALRRHRAAEGLEVSLGALTEADGALRETLYGDATGEDLYDAIFSRFCIGK